MFHHHTFSPHLLTEGYPYSGMTQVFVREFKKRDRGHIINIGSIAGREAYPGGSIYNATKFAVAGFTSSLLKELVATQVRVSEVQPG